MEAVYEVIRSIAVYLILVTVLLNLVSGNSYRKYVELVCGMVLIVIVLSPVARLLSLDDSFLYNFNLSSFKVEAMDTEMLSKAEEIQQQRLELEYEKFLLERITVIVENAGRAVKKAEIVLSEEDYGMIEEVLVEITRENGTNQEENITEEAGEKETEPVESIEPVKIGQITLSDEDLDLIKNFEEVQEKNKTTEAIRRTLASEFAMKEEQVIVYEKGE